MYTNLKLISRNWKKKSLNCSSKTCTISKINYTPINIEIIYKWTNIIVDSQETISLLLLLLLLFLGGGKGGFSKQYIHNTLILLLTNKKKLFRIKTQTAGGIAVASIFPSPTPAAASCGGASILLVLRQNQRSLCG